MLWKNVENYMFSIDTKERYFALRALQFWESALIFHYYRGKSGLNIVPDLKRKQIKYLKN
jgi:hypothetical protein